MIQTENFEATVKNNEDPEKRGRIQVVCVGLMGDEEEAVPQWVEPLYAWGWFIVPDVGEVVEVEVTSKSSDDEQFGQSSIDNLNIRWKGKRFWGNTDAEDGQGATPIPEDFTASNYGKRRGFSTPGGHVLMFDDTEGQCKITLTWKQVGSENRTAISIDSDGSVVMNTHAAQIFYMNAKDGSISAIDKNGNHLMLKDDKVSLMNANANSFTMKGDKVQILSKGNLTVTCAKRVTIDAPEIVLSDGSDFALLANVLIALLASHGHPDAFGTTGPATIGGTPGVEPWASAISSKVKVGGAP